MPRRGENVYKRKDGRWEGRILRPDGKYQYVYAKTYKDVKEKKNNFKEELKAKKKTEKVNTASAARIFETWLNEVSSRVRPSTFESYYRCMHRFVIPFFEKPPEGKLTGEMVSKFCSELTLSDSYKRKVITIFKTALKDIFKDSDEYVNILRAVSMPKESKTAVQVFSIKEQRLVEEAVMNFDDMRSLGILLCFYTGIRLGELCGLKWGDFDLEAGTMSISRTVFRTKNFSGGAHKTSLIAGMPKSRKSIRKIPLPGFLLRMTKEMKEYMGNDDDFILTRGKTPIDPRTYQKIYKRVLKSAGVEDRKFHSLRHSFATRALELGVDIKTLSEILGHTNVTITLNIYAHSLMEQKKVAIEKLNDMHMSNMCLSALAVKNSVAMV